MGCPKYFGCLRSSIAEHTLPTGGRITVTDLAGVRIETYWRVPQAAAQNLDEIQELPVVARDSGS